MPRNKREELVETALDLFMREGFHATGIDRILAEAGVAKMTLYHHFRSKDELILAALRLRDERFRNEFMRRVEKSGDDPALRLHAIFDVLGEMFDAKTSRGCTFINACAEYGDRDSAIHCIAAEHKRLVVKRFVERNHPHIKADMDLLRSGDVSAMSEYEAIAGPVPVAG